MSGTTRPIGDPPSTKDRPVGVKDSSGGSLKPITTTVDVAGVLNACPSLTTKVRVRSPTLGSGALF